MARMSLSQAAQAAAGKQPVQPVPLVDNPYNLSPALAPRVAAGESFLRDNMTTVPASRMSPPPPPPGVNAYRVVPAGTMYNAAGQRDGRAVGVPYGPGAYPVINTHNPTMVVLPPRLDLFSHMQNDYANFYRNMLPFIMQMSQRAMQQGARAARPAGRGNGSAMTPKDRPVEDLGSWNAYKPGVDMRGDRDSFALRQPGVRPDYKISPPAPGWQSWQKPDVLPQDNSPAQPAQPAQPAPIPGMRIPSVGAPVEPTYAPYGSFQNRWYHPFDSILPTEEITPSRFSAPSVGKPIPGMR